MNNNLRHFLLRSEYLLSLIYFIKRLFYKKIFFKEIDRRKDLEIFDINELSSPLSICPIDYCPDNNMYGLSAILKSYCGIPLDKPIKSCMEHGLYFGDYVSRDENYYPKYLKIITLGKYREEKLRKKGCARKITLIGPYINYAHSLLTEYEMMRIKEQFGKILLVFPSHSIEGARSEYDFNNFLQEICRLKSAFDSVWVCFFFADLDRRNFVDAYEKNGFKIVTCGHKYDLNFMNRQRTLMELSAATMSNDVGTHVGYSIALKKPHYIYRQKIENLYDNGALEKKHTDNILQESSHSYLSDRAEVYRAFSNDDFVITEEQLKVVEKYWGHLVPLSAKDLRGLI